MINRHSYPKWVNLAILTQAVTRQCFLVALLLGCPCVRQVLSDAGSAISPHRGCEDVVSRLRVGFKGDTQTYKPPPKDHPDHRGKRQPVLPSAACGSELAAG